MKLSEESKRVVRRLSRHNKANGVLPWWVLYEANFGDGKKWEGLEIRQGRHEKYLASKIPDTDYEELDDI